MAFGKRLKNIANKIDRNQDYLLVDAVKLVKEKTPLAKFDETIEVAMNLGVDPRHADQMVRGMVQLLHGTGKTCGLRYLPVVIRQRKRGRPVPILLALKTLRKKSRRRNRI